MPSYIHLSLRASATLADVPLIVEEFQRMERAPVIALPTQGPAVSPEALAIIRSAQN